jgi:hypothetical protein
MRGTTSWHDLKRNRTPREECERQDVPFRFEQTGAKFVGDGKLYAIPRRVQHAQARKAGMNFPG